MEVKNWLSAVKSPNNVYFIYFEKLKERERDLFIL